MRTTLDIPDVLFRQAKLAALERKTTLKALVASGLEKELGLSPASKRPRLTTPPIRLSEDSPLYHSAIIDDSTDQKEQAQQLNEVYRRR